MARGNGRSIYTANNRGNDALFNAADGGRGRTERLPLRLGYTIVDAGWQGDLAPTPTRLGGEPADREAARRQPDRRADAGRVLGPQHAARRRVHVQPRRATRRSGSYEAADTEHRARDASPSATTSTARERDPADRWAFGRCPTGARASPPSAFDICYFDGFQADKIYELIYPAKNPIVMGLGHAATRDVASFLRYETGTTPATRTRSAGGARLHPARLRDRRLADRRVPARLHLSRVQRGRIAPPGVRRHHPDHRRHRSRVHQRPLRRPERLLAARTIATTSCSRAIRRSPTP